MYKKLLEGNLDTKIILNNNDKKNNKQNKNPMRQSI